jgi:hypothetical protein
MRTSLKAGGTGGRRATAHTRNTQKGLKRRRAAQPNDWLLYLEPIVRELSIALEVLSRLRWAHALQRRGIAVAPLPAGRYSAKFAASEVPPPSSIFRDADRRSQVLAALKSPEDIAATVPRAVLLSQLAVWELELRLWGDAIWEKLGERIRLREQRANLIDFIHGGFAAGASVAQAALAYDQVCSAPNEIHKTRFGTMSRSYAPVDEFGNETGEEISPEELEELAGGARDERELRRLYRGEHKKSLGGVRDIDPALLRSAQELARTDAERTKDVGSVSSAMASSSGSVIARGTGRLVLRRADHGEQISRSTRPKKGTS